MTATMQFHFVPTGLWNIKWKNGNITLENGFDVILWKPEWLF